MSIKTLQKRIALVAVASLGFGLLSTVPASAAVSAITAVTLQEKTGGATDTSLVAVQAGSSTTRASAVTIYTNGSKVDLTDLELVVAASYGADSDTYFMLLSPDAVAAGSTAGTFTNRTAATTSAVTASAATGASTSTRVLPAFGAVTGTYTGLTTGNDNSTARRGLALGTHYLYVAPTTGTDYVGEEDWRITITVANPTMTAVETVIANSTTTLAGRSNQEVSIPITSTNALLAAGSGARPFMRFAAAITSQPSGTTVYPTLTAGSATLNTTFTRFDVTKSISSGSTLAISSSVARTSTSVSLGVASILYTTTEASGVPAAAVTTAPTVGTLTCTPGAGGP